MENETVWLSLNQMAELFQRDKSVISKHIKNVFDEGELSKDLTVANFATVQREGIREVAREIVYYNLDVIISVGYRVKSHRGTQFRMWATQRLKEFIIKGFTMNDDLLKKAGGGNYFEELLQRIRGAMETRFAELMWDNEPIPSGELVKLCAKELSWKKSTTYTMLRRLCERNIFQNNNGVVSSVITRQEFQALQSEQFVKETFDGSLPQFLTAFTLRKKLSEKEIDELQKLIDGNRG
ncbi:MAG: RhuM family protein [Dehalobacterium sp.]